MVKNDTREIVAHHMMAAVGGFFGIYALLNRSETFGSSETSNLIYMFVAGLSGDYKECVIRLVALLFYIGGIVFATLMARCFRDRDFRYVSIGVDAVCCVLLAQIPKNANVVIALYPMFFATAVQWLAFTTAGGYNCATIFSTNNVRQCFAGLTEYLCDRDEKQLKRFQFYGGTLLCFHAGVIYSWVCMTQWGILSIYACLPLIVLGFVTTYIDRGYKRTLQEG
jgi:uncharacterized membrane protein YoaK (UPF0700 family)